MPIYEYRCDCGNELQAFSHTFTPQEPACVECHQPMCRMVSLPAGLLSGRTANSLPPVPQSWNGVGKGSKEATTHWRRELDRRSKEFGADAPATRGEASLTCAPHHEIKHGEIKTGALAGHSHAGHGQAGHSHAGRGQAAPKVSTTTTTARKEAN